MSGLLPTARLAAAEVRLLGGWKEGEKGLGRKEGGDSILQHGEREDAPELGLTKNERSRKGQNHPHTSPIWHRSCDSLSSTWDQTREGLTFLSLLATFSPGEKMTRGLCLLSPSSPRVVEREICLQEGTS